MAACLSPLECVAADLVARAAEEWSLEDAHCVQVSIRQVLLEKPTTSLNDGTMASNKLADVLARDWTLLHHALSTILSAIKDVTRVDNDAEWTERAACLQRCARLLSDIISDESTLHTLVAGLRHASYPAGLSTQDATRLLFSLPGALSNALLCLPPTVIPSVPLPPALTPASLHSLVRRAVCTALIHACTQAVEAWGIGGQGEEEGLQPASALQHAARIRALVLGTPDMEEEAAGPGVEGSHAGVHRVEHAGELRRTLAHIAAFVYKLCSLGEAGALLEDWVQCCCSSIGWEACWSMCELPPHHRQPLTHQLDDARRTRGMLRLMACALGGSLLLSVLLSEDAPLHPRPASAYPSACASALMTAVTARALDYISATPAAGRMCPEDVTEGHYGRCAVGLLLGCIGRVEDVPGQLVAQLQWLLWAGAGEHARVKEWPAFIPRAAVAYLLWPRVLPVTAVSVRPAVEGAEEDTGSVHGYARVEGEEEYEAFFTGRMPLQACLRSWSAPSFLTSTPSECACSSTRLLGHACALAPTSLLALTSPIPAIMMEAVQGRLDSTNDAVRAGALWLARVCSERMSPESPLQLTLPEELARASQGVEGRDKEADEADGDSSDKVIFKSLEAQIGPDVSVKQALHRLRHGGEQVGGGEGEAVAAASIVAATSTARGEGKLSAMAKGDAHPLALARARLASRTPTTLHQACAMLHKACSEEGEPDPEGALALFATLAALVRTAAEGEVGQAQVLDTALPMLRSLLSSVDRYALPGWGAWRHAAMVACAVTAAPLTLPYLISVYGAPLYETSEGTRMEVLDVVVAAVRELVGRAPPPRCPLPPWLTRAWYPDAVDELGNEFPEHAKSVASAGSGSTSSTAPSSPPLGPDVFSDLLPATVYFPLLTSVLAQLQQQPGAGVEKKEGSTGTGKVGVGITVLDEDIAAQLSTPGHGALQPGQLAPPSLMEAGRAGMFAQTLRALAVLVEAAGGLCPTADKQRMCTSLLSLAWMLRDSNDAGVRCSVLSCCAAHIACVHAAGEGVAVTWPAVLGAAAQAMPGTEQDVPTGLAGIALLRETISRPTPTGSTPATGDTPLAELMSIAQRVSWQEGLQGVLSITKGERTSDRSLGATAAGLFSLQADGAGTARRAADPVAMALAVGGAAGPTTWDDLLQMTLWMKSVADHDPDSNARELARSMLGNAILRELVLGAADGC